MLVKTDDSIIPDSDCHYQIVFKTESGEVFESPWLDSYGKDAVRGAYDTLKRTEGIDEVVTFYRERSLSDGGDDE